MRPRRFGKVAALLMKKPKDDPRKRSDPRLNQNQAAAGNQDTGGIAKQFHRCGEMMKHIQPEDIGDACGTKRKLLRISDGIEPRTRNQVGGNNGWEELLKESRAGPDFDGEAV